MGPGRPVRGHAPDAPVAAGRPDALRRRVRRAIGPAVVALRRMGASHRVLPDFVIVGAQKAGTTTLYSQLVAHPSVLPALRKEVHYFDASPRAESWYRAFFPTHKRLAATRRRTGAAVTGEATPFYLCHPGAAGRMHAVVPGALVIVLLRDPVARAVSGYHHAVRMGFETRAIEVALDPGSAEPLASPDDLAWYDAAECPLRRRGYLARGHYAEQLERWFASFGRDRVLVLELGDLATGRAVAAALERLRLPIRGIRPVAGRNVASYRPPTPSVEGMLREYFRPYNAALFELLGHDYPWLA